MKCDLISERIFMPTLFFLEEPPCSLESVSVCPRRSLPWLLPPSRSRLWLLLSASTLSGLEDLFLLLCPPSKVCGSARKNMTNPDHRLSTASASKVGNTRRQLKFDSFSVVRDCAHFFVCRAAILFSYSSHLIF